MKNQAKNKIEPAVFVINSFDKVGNVINYMHRNHSQACEEGKPLVIRIDQKQEDRSKAQNRLYWKWLSQWAKHQGTDKDSEHLYFKRKFLSVIYERDDVGQYRKTFKAMRVLREEKHPMYDNVAEGLNELITTTEATVEQFTEYLNDIHGWCNKHGCYLMTPDDLKFLFEYGEQRQ